MASKWGYEPMPSEPKRDLAHARRSATREVAGWARSSRVGLASVAALVGSAAGLGAAGFRWLVYAFTWLATGHYEFGQQGRVDSLHFRWLGLGFLVLAPVIGGLVYGPLIQRFAREARGHGVPEVMLAVAENGGRIRPRVTVVKALASAICIGTGGSVGREGPIVQIGSAFASSVGQWVRLSETKLRILVACGAAGGIAATFNAPITGLFFGFEIVLQEFSLDALLAVILSAVAADLVSQTFFGSAPFFSSFPHDLAVTHSSDYLLVGVLGILAGLIGFGFKTVLYKLEDLTDRLWGGRPEWARPALGGIVLGCLLLALPEMYGVGYPVMDKMLAGQIVLWLLAVLVVAKILATSLTLSIGGSGGVFAPSLFTGAAAGMAFGTVAQHVLGNAVGSPALFAIVAMGGVFGAAAQAPLTAMASVVEMTGNFSLILPVMLATGLAAVTSKRLTYGSIYTTKLLRRGIDIYRPRLPSIFETLTVRDVMQQMTGPGLPAAIEGLPDLARDRSSVIGAIVQESKPQTLMADESLEQAMRQLAIYGPLGLPVVSPDRSHLVGWITRGDVLKAVAHGIDKADAHAKRAALAAQTGENDPLSAVEAPPDPLKGYEIVRIHLTANGRERRSVGELQRLLEGGLVAIVRDGELRVPKEDEVLNRGDDLVVLMSSSRGRVSQPAEEVADNPDH
jgi:chloride channel protein, CIC family